MLGQIPLILNVEPILEKSSTKILLAFILHASFYYVFFLHTLTHAFGTDLKLSGQKNRYLLIFCILFTKTIFAAS